MYSRSSTNAATIRPPPRETRGQKEGYRSLSYVNGGSSRRSQDVAYRFCGWLSPFRFTLDDGTSFRFEKYHAQAFLRALEYISTAVRCRR